MSNTTEIVKLTGSRGMMKKSISKMTSEEYKEQQLEANQEIRRTLFAKNMPLVHKKDGHVIAEYPNGTIEIIR